MKLKYIVTHPAFLSDINKIMLPEHKPLVEELAADLLKDTPDGQYEWLQDVPNICFWDFLDSLPLKDLQKFFDLFDIDNSPESGWGRFCEALGLKSWYERKWCLQYHGGKGPTQTALLKIKKDHGCDPELMLQHVLELIREMKRDDILLEINWIELAYEALSKQAKEIDSSIDDGSCGRSFVINEVHKDSISLTNSENVSFISKIEPLMSTNKKKTVSKKPWVLMVHASDAEDIAVKVAKQLREGNKKRKEIGVMLLSDEKVRRNLIKDPHNSIHKWFNEAWYIVPILSPEYLRQIQSLEPLGIGSEEANQNRFIYRLLLDQFCHFGSQNYRCRAVCEGDVRQEVLQSCVVAGNGLFFPVWSTKEKKIEEFAKLISYRPTLPTF